MQKLVENAKIQKFKCDIFGDFQTLWVNQSWTLPIQQIVKFVHFQLGDFAELPGAIVVQVHGRIRMFAHFF